IPSATPARTRSTPSAWKPRTTSTSDARAAQPMTNGMLACSGWSGPCRTMKTSFWVSAMSRSLRRSVERSDEEDLAAFGLHQERGDPAGAVDDRIELGRIEAQRVQRAQIGRA